MSTQTNKHPYIKAAIESELNAISNAPEGQQNNTLNRASFSLGQFIGGGCLTEEKAIDMLIGAGVAAGLPENEARKTAAKGLQAGTKKPRGVPSQAKAHTSQTDSWPDPMNLFDDLNLGIPSWTFEMAPAEINEFAFDEATRMGVRPEQIAGPAIVAAAACINDSIKVQPKKNDPTWQESARLWGAIIGESGAKKSPAKDRADGAIKEIELGLYQQHKDQMGLYDIELAEYETLSKREKKSTPPPKKPVQKRIMCSDITIEAMRELLKDCGGASKILCSSDELSGFFGSFDAYRGQSKTASRDRGSYLEMYNGGAKIFDRVGSGNIFVPNWSACISGTITRGVLAEVFNKLNTDGLLQRFLLYQAEALSLGEDRVPNRAAEEQYKKVIKRLSTMQPTERVTVVKLSVAAQKIRCGFEKIIALGHDLPGNSEALKSHLNKYSGLFGRLALTYHLVTDSQSNVISGHVAHMAAVALIDYHFPVARDFYNQIGFSDKKADTAKSVAAYILYKGFPDFSTRDIVRNVSGVKNDTKAARVHLETLEIYGWVRGIRVFGDRCTKWRVNPKVHLLFKDHAEKEKQRRAECAEKIGAAVAAYKKDDQHGDI